MINVNCRRCGVVNVVADETCKVCGADLRPAPAPREVRPTPQYQTPPPPSVNDVIKPFSGAGELINSTLSLYRDNFWLIAKISFVIVAPFEIFRALSTQQLNQDPQVTFGIFVLQILSNVLVVPALFYALLKVMQTGTAPGVNEAYRWGLGKIAKLSLVALLNWIVIGIALMLCIIPGIFMGLAFFVAYPVSVFENLSGNKALQRSYKLTEGRRWNILGASIVIGLIVMAAAIPAGMISGMLALNGISFWPLEAAAAIVADIIAEAGTVLTLVVYLSIMRALESEQSVIE